VLLSIPAPVRLIYIPNVLIVSGDAAATAHNIAAHETLFRLGTLCGHVAAIMTLFTTFALYRLLMEVNQNLGVITVA
jgi:Flp pilus assembly protein protease CpaA